LRLTGFLAYALIFSCSLSGITFGTYSPSIDLPKTSRVYLKTPGFISSYARHSSGRLHRLLLLKVIISSLRGLLILSS